MAKQVEASKARLRPLVIHRFLERSRWIFWKNSDMWLVQMMRVVEIVVYESYRRGFLGLRRVTSGNLSRECAHMPEVLGKARRKNEQRNYKKDT